MSRASLRALLRLARRTVAMSPWRSALVVALIGLPVAAMVGGATVLETVIPTSERRATSWMGAAEFRITSASSDVGTPELTDWLPGGSRIEPVTVGSDRVSLPGTEIGADLYALDLGGLASNMLTIVDGRQPSAPNEIAISPGLARLSGASIGGQISLRDHGTRTIVGLAENPERIDQRFALLEAAAAARAPSFWLASLPPQAFIEELAEDPSMSRRDLVQWYVWQASGQTGTDAEYPPVEIESRDQLGAPSNLMATTLFVLGALALVEAALVASAAFAVGIRRRQRELGLLAAAGAEGRHLAVTVLSEGALLGALGVLVGVCIGIALALGISPFLDELNNRRNPPLTVAPHWPLLATMIGMAAALIAAAVPAWTAARLPVIVALSGRRPPSSPARRMLRLGLVCVVLAIATTLSGSAMRAADPEGMVSLSLLVVGAVLGVLGFGACSPWLLERLEGLASRLPLSNRIALRDTARARSRSGPIVTAVLASVAATVAVAAGVASLEARSLEFWRPSMRTDQLMVQGPGAGQAGPQIGADLNALAAAPLAVATRGGDSWVVVEAHLPANREGEEGTFDYVAYGDLAVADRELLHALGGESALDMLEAGGAVIFITQPADVSAATVRVFGESDTESSVELPARVVLGGLSPAGAISVQKAAELGLSATSDDRFLIRLDHPVDAGDLDRAAALAQAIPDTYVTAERGPDRSGELLRLILLAAALVLALSVTGVAVVLGETEARPDHRTLLALGADPQLRRRITAARAGVLALLAGLLAVPAGLLPVWGVLASRQMALVVPLPEVIGALVILPVLAIGGALLLSRPIPRWSSFRGTT